MAPRVLLSLLLAVALLPSPAGGQASTAPVEARLEDGTGDVEFRFGGQNVAGAGGTMYPGADLTSLTMTEERSTIIVTVGVAKLPSAQDPGQDGTVYEVQFKHNGREFLVLFAFTVPALGPNAFGGLYFRDSPAGEFDGIWGTDAVILDPAANTMTLEVPRDLLADADGAAPYPGRVLEGIAVTSGAAFGDGEIQVFIPLGSNWDVHDAMPDDPALATSLPITMGVQQTGNARLASETPFRASNGEATTFIYNVSVVNLAQENDSFELSATGVPAGYTLVLPVPFVFVEGESAAQVPVLFTMPFGHQHGALASFVLEARSLSDSESVGRIEMGVRFLATPQPAGHHDTVYLHSRPGGSLGPLFTSQMGYINTLESDPNDQGINVHNNGLSSNGLGEWTSWWDFPLSPGLEMGIDVDSDKVGHLKVPVGTTYPLVQAKMNAGVYVLTQSQDEDFGGFFFGEENWIARMPETAPADITGGTVLIEGDLFPEGDIRIPFQAGNQLVLQVQLTWQGPNSLGLADENPFVAPGGSAVLPLREWHDSVDAVLSTVGGPTLIALGDQERKVNPGEAVVFPVSVSNPLDEDVTLVFEVSGSNHEWATLPSESLTAPAHETVTASLVVRAPPGAVDQERADLVLQAYSEDHPEARGLLRLVAEVDTDEDQQDDTAVAEDLEKKGTPAPGAAVLLALVALAAFLARRR